MSIETASSGIATGRPGAHGFAIGRIWRGLARRSDVSANNGDGFSEPVARLGLTDRNHGGQGGDHVSSRHHGPYCPITDIEHLYAAARAAGTTVLIE